MRDSESENKHRGISPLWLGWVASLWFVILLNAGFWQRVVAAIGGTEGHWPFLAAVFVLAVAFVHLVLWLLLWPRLEKPVLILLLPVSAAASWFVSHMGVMIDHEMIRNVMETDVAEASELLNAGLVWQVLLFGVLPAGLLWRLPVRRPSWQRALFGKLASLVLTLLVMGAAIAPFYKEFSSLLRNHRELRHVLVPTNYLNALHGYFRRVARADTPAEVRPLGLDARLGPRERPRVLVLVLGETARARNFSLDGYPRETNPELSRLPVFYFGQVWSCGTATAISVPCMFSRLTRDDFSVEAARQEESLLDVVRRAGASVLWRDNNSGCKGTCDRVPHESTVHLDLPRYCDAHECHDEILLHDLAQRIAEVPGDMLVVLHMKGQHGPAYYKRYPEAFRHFRPECRTAQLPECERQAIVNAYDNALRYTDHVLAETIRLLEGLKDRDTALLFVSDHGESLGENGIYLHGMPYLIAPDVQKRVPLVLWFSPDWMRHSGLDAECLRARREEQFSHDHLFHTVLGMLGVETALYDPALDMLAACRGNRVSAR